MEGGLARPGHPACRWPAHPQPAPGASPRHAPCLCPWHGTWTRAGCSHMRVVVVCGGEGIVRGLPAQATRPSFPVVVRVPNHHPSVRARTHQFSFGHLHTHTHHTPTLLHTDTTTGVAGLRPQVHPVLHGRQPLPGIAPRPRRARGPLRVRWWWCWQQWRRAAAAVAARGGGEGGAVAGAVALSLSPMPGAVAVWGGGGALGREPLAPFFVGPAQATYADRGGAAGGRVCAMLLLKWCCVPCWNGVGLVGWLVGVVGALGLDPDLSIDPPGGERRFRSGREM